MSPVIVTKNLFDRVHQSMILKDKDDEIIGGICFYEIKLHQCVSIIYFVVDGKNQTKGYGNVLMRDFKSN